jgi:multidrug transporter EmrE-like cation transporter
MIALFSLFVQFFCSVRFVLFCFVWFGLGFVCVCVASWFFFNDSIQANSSG